MRFQWQLIAGFLALLIIFGNFLQKPEEFVKDKFGVYIFLFLIICIVSKVATGWIGGAISMFFAFLPAIVVYYLTIIAVEKPETCKKLLFLICSLTCFLCAHAILQVNTGAGFGGLEPMLRGDSENAVFQACWYGVFHDPNDLGLVIVIVAPYTLHRALRYNPVYIAFFILIVGGVYSTNSRGTLVSLIAGLGMYLVFKKKSMKGLVLAGLIAMALFILGPSRVSKLNTSETSAAGRLEAWYEGMIMLRSSPILGIGPGNFTEHHYITAHNSFVLAASETGFFGLMFFCGVVLVPIWIGVKVLFKDIDQDTLGLMSAIMSGAIAGCVSISFISRTYVLFPYMMSGILNAVCRSYCPEIFSKEMETVSLKLLFIFAFGLLLAFFVAVFLFL